VSRLPNTVHTRVAAHMVGMRPEEDQAQAEQTPDATTAAALRRAVEYLMVNDWAMKSVRGKDTTEALAHYAARFDPSETAESLREQLDEAKSERDRMSANWRQEHAGVEVLRAAIDKLTEQRDEAWRNAASNRERFDIAKRELEKLQDGLDAVQDRLASVRAEKDSALELLQQTRSEAINEELQGELDAANAKIARFRATHTEAEAAWERCTKPSGAGKEVPSPS